MPRKRKVRHRLAASAEATVMTDQASADQTQANDDAQAETSFAQSEADKTDDGWTSLSNSLAGQPGGAWAAFELKKSQTLDSWQSTADSNYTQYVSTLAGDEVTYASTDSQKFLSEGK